MQATTAEMLDRYSIEYRKQLYGAVNGELLLAIRRELCVTFDYQPGQVIFMGIELGVLNSEIAAYEWAVREAKQLSLEEVGRRALAIRDLNAKRVAVKNMISAVLGQPGGALRYDKTAISADEAAKWFQEPRCT